MVDLNGSLVHYRVLFRHAGTTDDEIERMLEALLQGHRQRLSGAAATQPAHGENDGTIRTPDRRV